MFLGNKNPVMASITGYIGLSLKCLVIIKRNLVISSRKASQS